VIACEARSSLNSVIERVPAHHPRKPAQFNPGPAFYDSHIHGGWVLRDR
jgi:hypothetical protein